MQVENIQYCVFVNTVLWSSDKMLSIINMNLKKKKKKNELNDNS